MSLMPGDRLDYTAITSSEASGQEPGLLDEARLLARELHGVVHDYLCLAALETRQAGESLVGIIAMGLLTACVLLSAWLALVSAMVILLVQHSLLSASTALILVFFVHCLLAMVLVAVIRRRSRNLLFPATVSRLEPDANSDTETERSP